MYLQQDVKVRTVEAHYHLTILSRQGTRMQCLVSVAGISMQCGVTQLLGRVATAVGCCVQKASQHLSSLYSNAHICAASFLQQNSVPAVASRIYLQPRMQLLPNVPPHCSYKQGSVKSIIHELHQLSNMW